MSAPWLLSSIVSSQLCLYAKKRQKVVSVENKIWHPLTDGLRSSSASVVTVVLLSTAALAGFHLNAVRAHKQQPWSL